MKIRKAIQGDEYQIMELIQELALYEKAPDEVINTPEQLANDLFTDKICDCFVCEIDNDICGIALFYISYSTWKGKSLYLEDLYIKPQHRKKGIATKLFDCLLHEAKTIGAKRMDWQVLEWNHSAIQFYQSLGAHLDAEWINGRLFL